MNFPPKFIQDFLIVGVAQANPRSATIPTDMMTTDMEEALIEELKLLGWHEL